MSAWTKRGFPKRKADWAGGRVELNRAVTTGTVRMPAGTKLTVEGAAAVVRLCGDACGCCGIQPRLTLKGRHSEDCIDWLGHPEPASEGGLFADLGGPRKQQEGTGPQGFGARHPHIYEDDGTSDCANGCGCWMGPSRSGGPDGVDPFGECPSHPCKQAVEPPVVS